MSVTLNGSYAEHYEYLRHVLDKAWGILADGERELHPPGSSGWMALAIAIFAAYETEAVGA